ncbi:hypothetical protein DERP_006605, partial [Dermatophagoides pteronyssinus]
SSNINIIRAASTEQSDKRFFNDILHDAWFAIKRNGACPIACLDSDCATKRNARVNDIQTGNSNNCIKIFSSNSILVTSHEPFIALNCNLSDKKDEDDFTTTKKTPRK